MIPNGMRMRAATAKARARGFILSGAERPHLSERATVHSLTCSKDRSWLTCAALRIHTFASSLVVEVPCELLATCLARPTPSVTRQPYEFVRYDRAVSGEARPRARRRRAGSPG